MRKESNLPTRWSRTRIRLLLLGVVLWSVHSHNWAEEFSFQVRHDHDPWGGCRGELSVSDQGIEYRASKEAHSRNWTWTDIQSFDRISPQKFSLLTWEDRRLLMGLDRSFDFTILPESEPLSDEAFALVANSLKRPITDRIPEAVSPEYQILVKHLHLLGGCQGRLSFSAERVIFESDQPRHSRSWRRHQEIQSFWSPHPYYLEIHVLEDARSSLAELARFRFQLREPLDSDYYERLRRAQLVGDLR